MAFIELYYFYDEIQEKGPANRIKTIADELELFEEISVASIVGRAELLSALIVLIAFGLRLTARRRIGVPLLFVFAVLGLLAKEQGVAVLPLFMVYEALFGDQSEELLAAKQSDKSTDKPFDKSRKSTGLVALLKLKLSTQFGGYHRLIRATFASSYNGKLFTALICILFVRCRLLHDLPKFSRFDNPIDSLPSPFKQLNYLFIWLFNMHQFLNPTRLACDWSAQSIQLITSASNLVTLTLISASGLIYIVHQAVLLNNFKFLFLIAFTVITFLPASNLFFTVGFLFAERVLYLPSIGLCAIVAYSYQNLIIKLENNKQNSNDGRKTRLVRYLLRFFVVLICLSYGYRTHLRTFDWRTEHSLYARDLATNPTNVKLLNNLGKLYEKESNHSKAFEYYLRAIEIQPDDSRGSLNAANLHSKLGNLSQAELYYRQAIRTMPGLNDRSEEKRASILKAYNALRGADFVSGCGAKDGGMNGCRRRSSLNIDLNNDQSKFNNKNVVHLKQTQTVEHVVSTMQLRAALNLANLLSNNPLQTFEANRLYEQLILLKPDHGATYLSWIESILKSNSSDLRTIRHVLVQLLHNAERLDVNILYNVAVLISNSGNSMMALQLFDQILKLDPKHEEALLTSARIIRKNSEFNQLHEVAIERLEKFVSLNRLDHNVFFELGMLYMNFNIQKSIEYLQKAIEIKPDFSQALFNLGLLLYKQHRAQEAIPFLELLLKQDESHQKAMILLFAINSSKQN